MKKILAIALAVVMVLSMTAAFAWSWTCPSTTPKTGKATLEVIPYVKVNDGCGGFNWVQSNCAAAVSSENVFFAIKLTIPADINPVWYKHLGTVKVTLNKGGFDVSEKAAVVATTTVPELDGVFKEAGTDADKSSDGWVYYLRTAKAPAVATTSDVATGAWAWTPEQTEAASALDVPGGVYNTLKVINASKAKVCAAFTSDFKGYGDWLTYGDYKVYAQASDTTTTMPYTIYIINNCVDTGKVSTADTTKVAPTIPAGTEVLTLTVDKVTGKVWVAGSAGATACSGSFANAALAYFGIELGTCINNDNIKANFGWKDKVESCFTWSGNATAIVDVQCEVEIPKTGDVSVIAYAVMAVVAAAGAMGLKK